MENLIKFLEEKITDKMPVEGIVDVFEQMCSTPLEEDMVLFERLMNLLNDCDDVDQVYHNVSNYDDGEEEQRELFFFSQKNTVLMNRICIIYEQLHLL